MPRSKLSFTRRAGYLSKRHFPVLPLAFEVVPALKAHFTRRGGYLSERLFLVLPVTFSDCASFSAPPPEGVVSGVVYKFLESAKEMDYKALWPIDFNL